MCPKGDEHDNKPTVAFSYKPNPSRRFTPSTSSTSSSSILSNIHSSPSTVESLPINNNPEVYII